MTWVNTMKKILIGILLTALLTIVSIHAEGTTITAADETTAATDGATAAPLPASSNTAAALVSGKGTILDWLVKSRTDRAQGIKTEETASTRWGTYVSERRTITTAKKAVGEFKAQKKITCNDSDNLTYGTKGYVKGYNIKDGQFTFEDTCVRKDSLREWYCHKDAPKTSLITCSRLGKGFTCNDGACKGPGNTESCSNKREYCAGVTGQKCCKGYTCKMDGKYADAGGTCVKGTSITE